MKNFIQILIVLVWIVVPLPGQCYQETVPSGNLSAKELHRSLRKVNHAIIYDSEGKVLTIITVGENGNEDVFNGVRGMPDLRENFVQHSTDFDSTGMNVRVETGRKSKKTLSNKVAESKIESGHIESNRSDTKSTNPIKRRSSIGMKRSPKTMGSEGMYPNQDQKLDGTMRPSIDRRRPAEMSVIKPSSNSSMMKKSSGVPATDMSQISEKK